MPGGGGSPFLGQIMLVGFNFPPQGWASCDGQLLAIAQNDALFALLGTTYGGDGQATFALPDLRGRVPIHQGTGPNGTWTIGEVRGVETVTLTLNQMAAHNHTFGLAATSTEPTTDRPDNSYPAVGGYYAAASTSGVTMPAPTIASAGGTQPHGNMQPYLGINFIIAVEGIFPSQN
jgi:microcystin-dependent protein